MGVVILARLFAYRVPVHTATRLDALRALLATEDASDLHADGKRRGHYQTRPKHARKLASDYTVKVFHGQRRTA